MKKNKLSYLFVTTLAVTALSLQAADNLGNSSDPSLAQHSHNVNYHHNLSADNQIKASSLIGKTIKNDQNETVGKVKDLVVDVDAGSVPYAIVSVGGMSAKHIAVPITAFQCSENGDLRLSVSKEELKSASMNPQGSWATVSGQTWTRGVDGYYGQPTRLNRFERESSEPGMENREAVRTDRKASEKTMDTIANEPVDNNIAPTYRDNLGNVQMAPADMTLKSQVNQRLNQDYTTDTLSTVNVRANNGVVTLTGSVATQSDKDSIESKVKSTSGVNQVDNQLTVRNP